jgi:hypothetical protein
MKVIPTTDGLARYTQRTILDGREYIFSFNWNSRAAKWSVSIADALGVGIVDGIYLVCGLPLLRLLSDSRSPPGDMYLLDRDGDTGDPGFNDLGKRCLLIYVEANETFEPNTEVVTSGQAS